MNEILYCDLDGTLIRDNLEGAFVAYLRRRRELSVLHYAAAAFTVPVNAFRRRFFLPHPFKSWTAFRSASEKRELISRFLENEGANISFAPNVLRFVEDFKGKKVLLTGSDEDLAAAFLKFTERSDLFDEVCGSKTAPNGFAVIRHPFGRGKLPFIDAKAASVGIGNEYADRFFLEKCSKAYVAAPDGRLRVTAVKSGWKEL